MVKKAFIPLALALSALTSPLSAETLWVSYGLNQLSSFDTATPATLKSTVTLSSLQPGESILGIDFRPRTGELYALGSTGRLYKVSPTTGVAQQVGAAPLAISGTRFGFDFNPTVDRIRIVGDSDQNLRAHPDTGALAAADANLRYAAGDVNAGDNPLVSSAAYTNNLDGVGTTALYDIDIANNVLVTQNPPNDGVLNTVGPLNVIPSDPSIGFDISSQTGTAYAAINTGSGYGLYRVSLDVGGVRRIGAIGSPAITGLTGLAAEISAGTCIPSTTRLCLNGDRFAVTAAWRSDTASGTGQGTELFNDSGYFTFFSPTNTELVIKVLDACADYDRYWVFVSGITNVEVTLTVTDTKTNTVWTRVNPRGTNFVPIFDTDAFDTCP